MLPDQNSRSYISKLFRTKSGQLYVGNSIGEVWRESNDVFEKINLPEESNSQVINFFEDADGYVWICTKTTGIFKFDPRMNDSVRYLQELKEFIINSFEGVTRKSFLVGTNEGLFICRENLNEHLEIVNRVEEIPSAKITFVQQEQNYWWVGTSDQGLYKIQLKPGNELGFTIVQTNANIGLDQFAIRSATVKDDAIYVASASNGLLKIVDNNKILYTTQDNLSSNNLYCLYIDHQSNLWIGTFGKGLSRLISSSFVPFNEVQPITREVHDFAFQQNELYVSTDSSFVHYTRSDGKWNKKNEERFKKINSFFIDNETIYFNETDKGVFMSDINFENTELILDQKDVNHLLVRNDKLYVSTSTEGLIILDLSSKKLTSYSTNNGLTHNEILNSYIDDEGIIWLAMSGGVLNAIDHKEVKIYGTNEGLHPFDFTSFTQDNNGNIWIASDGGGIYMYDGKSFSNFTKEDGLHSNYILSISQLNDLIYASGKDALSLIETNPKMSSSTISTKEDIYDFSIQTNGLDISNNQVWMATDKGLFRLKYPKIKRGSNLSATAYFTQISINDSLYDFSERIELPYGSYRVELKYRISCLDNPGDVRYRYFVEGLEEDYGKQFKESICYYPGMGPGEYEFNIISSGCDGNWNGEPLKLSMRIDRPIYQKPWFIGLASLALIGFIYIFIRYRERENRKIQNYLSDQLDIRTAEVRKQKDELAVKNKEIQDSIVYAERIQKSMLSNEKLLKSNTKDYFIFYRPRDIVSGDFYWFHNTKNHFFFAGADCTGHGVPGSMMSMICISELDKEININEKIEPGQILKDIDISVRETLHKNEQEQTNDGMDIALCVFDKKKKVVQFAGASRPCYVIQNNELIEFKGTRAHIGGAEREEKEFEQIEIPLNGKTRFYLTSDGFVDQFGGEKGKKFMRKNFRTLMSENQELSMTEQQMKFMKTFMSWKGHLDQVDDVLVIGIEL